MLAIDYRDVVYFSALIFFVFAALLAYFVLNLIKDRSQKGLCPYTGKPLRRGEDLPVSSRERVLKYLFDMHDYHNRLIDFKKAAFCRETGRIFSDAIISFGRISVDWSFLQKRFPGNFVSWGSLSLESKTALMEKHGSLKAFQTEFSSSRPSPKDVEEEYANEKPGPLYVDPDTGVLLGWQEVPETNLEVLIVQKPKQIYIPGVLER